MTRAFPILSAKTICYIIWPFEFILYLVARYRVYSFWFQSPDPLPCAVPLLGFVFFTFFFVSTPVLPLLTSSLWRKEDPAMDRLFKLSLAEWTLAIITVIAAWFPNRRFLS